MCKSSLIGRPAHRLVPEGSHRSPLQSQAKVTSLLRLHSVFETCAGSGWHQIVVARHRRSSTGSFDVHVVMGAFAKQVMVGRLVHCRFGRRGASLWTCLFLMMCTLLLCRFGSNVGAELSHDGHVLLNFSRLNMDDLGQCQGAIASWNASDDTPCGWIRVSCTPEYAVRRLDFSGCSMSPFSQLYALKDLGSLQELDLSSNPDFSGIFALDALVNFRGLRWLDISGSWSAAYRLPSSGYTSGLGNLQYLYAEGGFDGYYVGPAPSLVGLRELVVLSLAGSAVYGEIQEDLRNLTKLVSLDLSNNFLKGSMPDLGGLTRLTQLSLTNSNLSGDVPAAPSLQYLDAAYNSFTNLTDAFFQMSALRRVNLSRNQLGGQLPDIMGLKFPRLEVLDMSWNELHGPIPSTLQNVTHLDLSQNSLSGPIPPDFRIIASVHMDAWVDLSGNELSGNIPASLLYIPTTSYVFVNLSTNALVGHIPGAPLETGVLLEQVWTLDLSDNQLSGPLPSSFSSHITFYVLWLQNNKFSGDLIGPLLSSLRYVSSLRVQGNRFTGDLTKLLDSGTLENPYLTSVWDLSHNNLTMMPSDKFPNPLQSMLEQFCSKPFLISEPEGHVGLNELRLAGSDLMGQPMPDRLNCSNQRSLEYLQVLDLACCNLSGTVPQELFNDFMPNLTFLNVSNNRLFGAIPNRTLPLTLLKLDLGNNNLEGEMTVELFTSLPNLLHFNASNNKLSGPIPGTFPLALQVLDLRHNNLTGEIPGAFFFSLPNLKYINLSGNNLSGTIPDGLPAALHNASFFADNPGLCGAPLEPCITPQPPAQRGLVIKVWVLGIVVVAVVLVCTGSCLLLVWRWKVYTKKHQQDADLIATLLERETVTVMPLRELRRATANFSESAQIGVGGFGTVYAGELSDGTAVAIKKGKREGSPQYKQQFLNEVRILSGVNHRYLVKLLGCSMENKVALLVFEFVPNGTLQEHLEGKREGFLPLSWRQRLLIALQTADALAYLHSAADPSIIHRDVKSSNILLDHDLNAKVADFGISKLAPSNVATHFSTVAVQGTMGYIDPEYYVSIKLTPRSDVYSFGVVLLELISAKPAIDFQRGQDEASLVNLAFSAMDRGEWERLIDPVLADTFSLANGRTSIETVGALAVRCLAFKSRERPEMREVWKVLQTIWLQWDSDAFQPNDVQHDLQPQHPHSDAYASYDSMSSQQSPHVSQFNSFSTSGSQIY